MSRSVTENLHLTRNGSVQKSYLQEFLNLRLTQKTSQGKRRVKPPGNEK